MSTPRDDTRQIDFALAVEGIYDNAQFRLADSYPALVRTWDDKRPVTTLTALETSWKAYLTAEAEREAKEEALTAQREDNRQRLDVEPYKDAAPQIKALAEKIAWLEAEIRDLRRLNTP